jgi:hypothetical protein
MMIVETVEEEVLLKRFASFQYSLAGVQCTSSGRDEGYDSLI